MFRKTFHRFSKLQAFSFSVQSEWKFLVTGCGGQVGSALIPLLYKQYGVNNVLCSDVSNKPSFVKGNFTKLDVSDNKSFREIAFEYKPTSILHLAAILSGKIID
jgi:nucleoside-diphosphate-sugar epimerase